MDKYIQEVKHYWNDHKKVVIGVVIGVIIIISLIYSIQFLSVF